MIVISNEVLIVGIADSMVHLRMYQVGNLMYHLFLLVCELFLLTLTLECTVWGPTFLIGINQYVATLQGNKCGDKLN